jgi:hypothetical protein
MRKNNWRLPRSFALSFLRVSRGRVLLTWIGAVRTLESKHLPGGTTMAQQKSVTLIDDLDGGKAAETITFGLDGASYEIDLSKKNATALRKAVADFVEHGRRVKAGAAPAKAQRPPVPRQGPNPAAVRLWATAQGIAVSARGRVPADLITQYEAAQT